MAQERRVHSASSPCLLPRGRTGRCYWRRLRRLEHSRAASEERSSAMFERAPSATLKLLQRAHHVRGQSAAARHGSIVFGTKGRPSRAARRAAVGHSASMPPAAGCPSRQMDESLGSNGRPGRVWLAAADPLVRFVRIVASAPVSISISLVLLLLLAPVVLVAVLSLAVPVVVAPALPVVVVLSL